MWTNKIASYILKIRSELTGKQGKKVHNTNCIVSYKYNNFSTEIFSGN